MASDTTHDNYLRHFTYPPEPEGRTVVRHWSAKLALAVIKDAVELTFRHPPRVQLNQEQKRFAATIAEAKRWLSDHESMEPFSLSWCCWTLSVFSGVPWDAKAVSDAYRAGRIRDFSFNHVTRNGGNPMRIEDTERIRRRKLPSGRRRPRVVPVRELHMEA